MKEVIKSCLPRNYKGPTLKVSPLKDLPGATVTLGLASKAVDAQTRSYLVQHDLLPETKKTIFSCFVLLLNHSLFANEQFILQFNL